MIQRCGEVAIQMLADVKQRTIRDWSKGFTHIEGKGKKHVAM